MEKINISDELTAKIGRYVKEGRFSDFSDFFTQAASLLLMAEDNKGAFEQVLKKEDIK
jgi:Arc/MetJ-type ribon-helix-helix transcriptional regulator